MPSKKVVIKSRHHQSKEPPSPAFASMFSEQCGDHLERLHVPGEITPVQFSFQVILNEKSVREIK